MVDVGLLVRAYDIEKSASKPLGSSAALTADSSAIASVERVWRHLELFSLPDSTQVDSGWNAKTAVNLQEAII